MVVDGSVSRQPGSLTVDFVVTDYAHTVPVRYTGVLPDLFREGSGVVARGKLGADGRFEANEIVAKHDENYMPPDVAAALKKGKAQSGGISGDAAPAVPPATTAFPAQAPPATTAFPTQAPSATTAFPAQTPETPSEAAR
jgi:cytochrome c-type biogenesis protein CcmE